MMIPTYYLKGIALLAEDLDQQAARISAKGGDDSVFIQDPIALTDEGNTKIGSLRYFDGQWYFVPDDFTWHDFVDLGDPTAVLPNGSTGSAL